MANVRQEIIEMYALGPLPGEVGVDLNLLKRYEALLSSVKRPVTDEEACVLIKLFGLDGCFGAASSLMHLIETAPSWPIEKCLRDTSNEWIVEMRKRCIRGGQLPLDDGE